MGGGSDLNILVRMLDGLGVENPHAAAVRMLERFGGFSGVFAATESELEDTGLSSRAASFFAYVDPTLRRMANIGGPNSAVTDERTAVGKGVSIACGRNRFGEYAVYLDGTGKIIDTEFLSTDGGLSGAAVGACRYRTKKLLLISVMPDGDVSEIKIDRAEELESLICLSEILEMEFVDYIETTEWSLYR